MKLKNTLPLLLLSLFFFQATAQTTERTLQLDEVVQMALENHTQLKLSSENILIPRQQTKNAPLQKLPSITASANVCYLSDALIPDKDLFKTATVSMPRFGNTFSVLASALIFKGGLVKQSIEVSELREQLAELDLEKDEQNINFLVMSDYHDI